MHVADIGVKCPVCGVKFSSKQLPVIVDTNRRNSELRQDFEGKIPQFEQYAVCTCPSCGYADWAHRYEVTNETSVLTARKLTPHIQFRSAAIAAEKEGRDFYSIGIFYLYAAWCADDSYAVQQAKEYRKLAVDFLKKSLVDGSCPKNQKEEIQYLVGEIMRRAGDFEQSKDHFRQVMPRLSSKFALMARKLMKLAESQDSNPIEFEWGEKTSEVQK
jgi:uncharacterized protein (DUF2225 family)